MEVLKSRAMERGVTLVETLIALVILAIVTVSILTMFSQGMQMNISGADYTSITNVAKDQFEELMALPYTDPELTQGTHSYDEWTESRRIRLVWIVGEHNLAQGNADPETLMGADPTTSTVAEGLGNIKYIRITVNALSEAGLGRRSVTMQGVKVLTS